MANATRLSESETALLKQSRNLAELIAHPGWKVFESLIRHHMSAREMIYLNPIHELEVLHGMDGLTRMAALEHIKGVYNGLKQAISLPQTIVDEAKALRDKSSPDEEDSK